VRIFITLCCTVAVALTVITPANAQSAPGQTVNVTPNQQTTSASAVSNPTGQNISQQNNFFDPSANSFGPGVSCSGPYIASSIYRDDTSSALAGIGGSGYSDTGGTIGLVVPLNGTNKKCQEFVNEVLFQRQIDTCLSMMKQGFAFDPNGQYATIAKRCAGIKFTGSPTASANPISPPQPPTVITVPASPASNGGPSLPPMSASHTVGLAAPPVVPTPVIAIAASAPAPNPQVITTAAHAMTPLCQPLDPQHKKALIAIVRSKEKDRSDEALARLHAACLSDHDILALVL
jgi:hypothetical protein